MALFCVCLTSYPALASSLAIQIIQYEQGQTALRPASYVFEDSVMDYCFERGFIVSNVPAVIGKGDRDIIQTIAMNEAAAGKQDFYVAVALTYNTASSTNPDAVRLSNIGSIEWTAYRLSDSSRCGSDSISRSQIATEDDTEEGFTVLARQVASRICMELK